LRFALVAWAHGDREGAAATVTDDRDVLRAHGYHTLTVKHIVQETDDTRSFVLDIPDDLRTTFEYRPGQFCTFRVRIGDEEHLRSYSMSSAPETDPDLTVTVKRVPGGLVSNWLLDHVSVGDTLETTKPAGVFCLRQSEAPVVAFCGGSGVTPVLSLAKSALTSTGRTVRLVYANRHRDSVIFEAALDELRRSNAGRLDVHHHLDTESGFLVADAIAQFAGSPDSDFYICGPGPFMDLVESTLLRIGVPPANIFIERFLVGDHTAAPTPAGSGDEQALIPETVTVIMKGKKTPVPYQRGDTILETARRGALRPPFSCEAGDCATCMAILREGSATMRVNNALTPEEVEEGWVLTCQAIPVGATVTVEYEAM
jgi:3-ketosteroid 9alpha-monooxygenase subunit B